MVNLSDMKRGDIVASGPYPYTKPMVVKGFDLNGRVILKDASGDEVHMNDTEFFMKRFILINPSESLEHKMGIIRTKHGRKVA